MGIYHIGSYIKRAMLAVFVSVALLGYILSPAFAEDFSNEEIYDLILEVKRDRTPLSNAFLGLEKSGKYYIPVQELARLVLFNANIDLKAGRLHGFIGSEDNLYSLNIKDGTYSIKGTQHSFDKNEAFIFEQKFGIGDLYATPELLNKIWPLELSLDTLKQTLEIQTKRTLPYESLSERQRKRQRRLDKFKNKAGAPILNLPRIENNYKLFSLPALDFHKTLRFDNKNGGVGHGLNVTGRNDLLKTQASYNFSFEREAGEKFRFENARFLLERKAYEEGDLPLGLNLFQAGDIRPRPSRLIDGSLKGRGVLLSTEPQKQVRDFDEITVEGLAEPGWEVELYRNNELIDFQVVDESGEYRFENITLNFNNTVIRTLAYGPEGQVREDEQTYNISNAMLKPGKTVIEASILDFERDLILTDNEPKNRPEGVAQNIKIKRGITSWLSAFTSFTKTPTKQSGRRYATLGFNLSFLGLSSLIEGYRDLSGGHAVDVRTAGNFAGTNLNLRTAFMSGFESEEIGFDAASKTTDLEFTASRPIQLPFGSLGLRFRLDHEKFRRNPTRTELDFSQTYYNSGLRLTHGNSINLLDRHHQKSDGRINATYRINPNWQLRSLLNYDIFPKREFQNVLAELRYKDNKKFTASADINRNLQDQTTRLGGQVSYDFDTVRTSLDMDWEKEAGFRTFLRASFSMAPYGKNGDYIFSSKSLSSRAALSGRTFLDKNYDGEFNGDDEPLEDVVLDIGKRETKPSNKEGYATYIGSPKNEYENILLNFDSLENPFMVSPVAGYSTLLRPASAIHTDFPVIETGVIDGTIYTHEGALAGVRIELLANNEVIDNTTSAFDGFYTFEYVNPGDYIIRIDPSYEQLNVPPKEISVTSKNLFHYGVDFNITGQADEEACVEIYDIKEGGRITPNCQSHSTQGGTPQPAHTLSERGNTSSIVQNIRIGTHPDYMRLTLDLSAPTNFKIIEAKDNKEITIQFPEAVWNAAPSWKAQDSSVLKGFMVEENPLGGTKIILQAVSKINIKQSETLKPDEKHGHRIYFDLVK
ncbi:MAG: carboxypeptidase-like regulatory domain-containing protein [Alphaproteobacteria bacterium]|nr:carboxypeptidase-like regulatory domain-containing protein [Alphaproteobacteria bacterium]